MSQEERLMFVMEWEELGLQVWREGRDCLALWVTPTAQTSHNALFATFNHLSCTSAVWGVAGMGSVESSPPPAISVWKGLDISSWSTSAFCPTSWFWISNMIAQALASARKAHVRVFCAGQFSEWVKFVTARFAQNALKHVSYVKKDQHHLVRVIYAVGRGNWRVQKVLVWAEMYLP